MKQPKLSELKIDKKGTQRIRAMAAKTSKVKITINIDLENIEALKALALKSGASYQKLLNQILADGLSKKSVSESRLDRIEKELARLRKKLAA
jgi:predicted DNA binding CopG/RHH family protein